MNAEEAMTICADNVALRKKLAEKERDIEGYQRSIERLQDDLRREVEKHEPKRHRIWHTQICEGCKKPLSEHANYKTCLVEPVPTSEPT